MAFTINHMSSEARSTAMAVIHNAMAALHDHNARLSLNIQDLIRESGVRGLTEDKSWHGEGDRLRRDLAHAEKVLEVLVKYTDRTEAVKQLDKVTAKTSAQKKLQSTIVTVLSE